MLIIPSIICLQLVPQLLHIPTPNFKGQLLSCLVSDLDPELAQDGYLLFCDAATDMFVAE